MKLNWNYVKTILHLKILYIFRLGTGDYFLVEIDQNHGKIKYTFLSSLMHGHITQVILYVAYKCAKCKVCKVESAKCVKCKRQKGHCVSSADSKRKLNYCRVPPWTANPQKSQYYSVPTASIKIYDPVLKSSFLFTFERQC